MIDCKSLVQIRKDRLKEYDFGDNMLCIIQVGDNQASNSYIKGKMRDCDEVGIKCVLKKYNENIPENIFIDEIKMISEYKDCKGIIVQLPLPEHMNVDKVLKAVPIEKDVDGFLSDEYTPCTPKGVISLLDDIGYSVEGKTVCIIGKGRLSGMPLLTLLASRGATVIGCNSKTPIFDREVFMNMSDIVISAVGKPSFIHRQDFTYLPDIIIDIGINLDEEGKLCGDCEKALYNVVENITPVPNGMGLYTRVSLLENFKEACKKL